MFVKLLDYFKTACTAIVVLGVMIVVGAYLTRAAAPGIINYQGRVQVNGGDFTGSGQFKFALVNPGGTATYWSNDGSSVSGKEPTTAVPVTVTKGLYAVVLGDVSLVNMTVIPNTVFSNPDVRLRIWFNDGTNGSQLLAPDQRMTAIGYAFVAAAVDDLTITNTKIADGAVTSAKLAAGVLPTTLPPSGTAGGDLTGTYPNPTIGVGAVTNAKIANLAVTAAQLSSGVATNGQVLTANGTGGVLFSSFPKCRVFGGTGTTTASFTGARFNDGGIWSLTNPTRLTAPNSGVCHIFCNVLYNPGSSANLAIKLTRVDTTTNNIAILRILNSTIDYNLISTEFKLNAGDYVELVASGGGTFQTSDESTTEFGMSYIP